MSPAASSLPAYAAPVFVRIRQSTAVQQGDEILAGEVTFRVEMPVLRSFSEGGKEDL